MHVSRECPITPGGAWKGVALSGDLARGEVRPVVVAGEELALWRSEAGTAHVWADRCPHRGMRLSFGAVLPEGLVCPYHGWRFGDDGHCNHIPAHPGTRPRASRTRTLPTVERDGVVWTSLVAAPEGEPPALGGVDPVRSLALAIDVAAATAGLAIFALPGGASTPVRWRRVGDEVLAEADGAPADVRVRVGAGGVVRCDAASGRFVAVLAPVDDATAMLHLAVPAGATQRERVAVHGAAIAFRHWLDGAEAQRAARHAARALAALDRVEATA